MCECEEDCIHHGGGDSASKRMERSIDWVLAICSYRCHHFGRVVNLVELPEERNAVDDQMGA